MLVKVLTSGILGFLGGVLLHSIFFTMPISGDIIIVMFGVAIVCTLCFPNRWILYLTIFIIGISSGLLRYGASIETYESTILDVLAHEEEIITVQGSIMSDPISDLSYTSYILQVEHLIVAGEVVPVTTRMLVRTDTYTHYQYRDTVIVKGTLQKPDTFITDTDRNFDYGAYLGKDGVYYTLAYADSEVIGAGKVGLRRSLFQLKNTLLDSIHRFIPEPESGLLAGILFGEKLALAEDYEEKFRIVGLMHIVVLSGYNVAVVIQLLVKLLGFLPLRARALAAVCGIVLFALLVGGGPTVVRASIMAVFIVLANVLGRQYHIERALIIAGFIMIIVNPKILYFDISFQLSFLATYGLVVFTPWLEEKLSFLPRSFAIRDSAVATLAAQIMVMPLIIYQIGEFSLISPLVNVLVLFAVPISMLLGFLTSIMGFVWSGTLAVPLAIASTYLLKYQLWIVDVFARVPLASITIPPFPVAIMIILYAILGYIVYRMKRLSKI